jgi:2-phospho-L-lactate guanylyltransferase
VLIPLKGFGQAKQRLGDALSSAQRIHLVRTMAERVVAACTPLAVAVVCDDDEVAAWAEQLGVLVIQDTGSGLNGAVRVGVNALADCGVSWVTVAHGDLPYASGIGTLGDFDGITLVPDRVDDGTNILRLPVGGDFSFAYGPGSFRAHRAEAARLGLAVRVIRQPALAYDVDLPADVIGMTP